MAIDLSKIPLSRCTTANGLVFVSGQLGFLLPGILIEGGISEQTRQAIRNIEEILKANSSSLRQVIKTTVWLTDAADFQAFNEAYADGFGSPPFPARSTVVSSLLISGAKVEIEAVAKVGE
jgi:2-iminobutanoate/2-iminopropanoate deaminase